MMHIDDKFIYVFSKEARDELLGQCYKILKNDEKSNVFIFLNEEDRKFSTSDFSFALSNTLSF